MIKHKGVSIWGFRIAIFSGNGFMEQSYPFMEISCGKRHVWYKFVTELQNMG